MVAAARELTEHAQIAVLERQPDLKENFKLRKTVEI
jgi:hypothetical protein